jgi:hypothetical protein
MHRPYQCTPPILSIAEKSNLTRSHFDFELLEFEISNLQPFMRQIFGGFYGQNRWDCRQFADRLL